MSAAQEGQPPASRVPGLGHKILIPVCLGVLVAVVELAKASL
jgi:hypothetical protein